MNRRCKVKFGDLLEKELLTRYSDSVYVLNVFYFSSLVGLSEEVLVMQYSQKS